MKKRIYLIYKCMYISILLFIFLIFFNITYASTIGTVYLSSNKDVLEKGEEIEITLCIENVKTAVFTSYLYFDDLKLEYVSGPDNTNIIENRIIYVWYDETGGNSPKEGELAKFKFRAKANGVAKLYVQGDFYSADGQLIETNFKDIDIKIGKEETNFQKQAEEQQAVDTKSNNATLQVLRLDKEGIVPSFDKDVYEYYLTINNEINDIEVLAISENSNATIEITGNTDLKEGLNLITIKVISEDKTQSKVYTVQVTKTANIELANTNLETLAIENILLNPPFDITVTHYNIEVSNDTTNLNILAVPENESATVQITGKDNLQEGNNLIEVTVTAQNGFSKKVYEISAYKRNLEEENEYKLEQEANREKLEQIYQVEKTSNELEEDSEEFINEIEKQNQIIWIVAIAIGIILVICFIVFKYRKTK